MHEVLLFSLRTSKYIFLFLLITDLHLCLQYKIQIVQPLDYVHICSTCTLNALKIIYCEVKENLTEFQPLVSGFWFWTPLKNCTLVWIGGEAR
jgi:hypothetical protein